MINAAKTTAFIFITGFFFLAVGLSTPVYGEKNSSSIELQSSVEIVSAPLMLSDIVVGDLPDKMSDFYLAELPAPGRGKFITRAKVIMRARQAGFLPPEFIGREIRTHVQRPARVVTRQELEKPVHELLQAELESTESGEIKINYIPRQIEILPGEFELELDRSNPYHRINITNNYTVNIYQNGDRISSMRVRAEIRDYRSVPVTIRRISAGEKLTEDDIEIQKKNIRNFQGDIISTVEGMVGYETTRTISEGSAIRSRDLEKPLMVERNRSVTIRYQLNGLVITAAGTAESNGHMGDKIVVRNNSSGEQVYAEVIGKRRVRIANGNEN